MALSAGTRLGPYEILAPLGAGGMGEVYRARDPRLKREVALKVLPEEVAQDPERLERFEREAQTLAALSHPHIVTIFSVEEAEGVRFLTMELVEGKTLSQVLPRGGLALPRFFRIAVPLSEAMAAAHEKGITHRDLKPGNVMVTDDDRVKVLDFGLAKLEPAATTTEDSQAPTDLATDAGQVLGTAPYMSPEQVRGKPADPRSDVFSLGIVLYEMLTGDRPFQGDTSAEVASSILRDSPSVMERRANLPRELGKLITHCLEKDPRKRYQSTLDLANDLEVLRREVDSGEAPTAVAVAPSESPKGRFPVRLGALALVPFLAAVVGWQLWTFLRPPAPETERSIAVLPLATLGGGEDDDFFSSGLTEDIVTQLSKIPDLKVASSRSSLRYRDTDKDLEQIGEELGVATLLVGTIRRHADRVRVNVELIEASTGQNRWAEVFDGQMSDIFAIQGRIAEDLAGELQVQLSAETRDALERGPTVDPEVYELVLRARHLRNTQENLAGLTKAAEHLEVAIEKDPNYAPAWAALGEVRFISIFNKVPGSSLEKAVSAADRALELDDQLAEAHLTKGVLLAWLPPKDLAAGEAEIRRAIELDPRLANAHRELGNVLFRMLGRVEEGVDAFIAADELEPFWALSKHQLRSAYLAKGDLVGAMRTSREYYELRPSEEPRARGFASMVFQDFEGADGRVQAALEKEDWTFAFWLAHLSAAEGLDREVSVFMEEEADGRSVSGSSRPTTLEKEGARGVVALFAREYSAAARDLARAPDFFFTTSRARPSIFPSRFLSDADTVFGCALLGAGERERALRHLDEAERAYRERIAQGDTSFEARIQMSAIHALRGDKEAAYDWLQQAIDTGFFAYAEAERHPFFESLHEEERFRQMMAGVKTTVEEMRRQVEAFEGAP